MHLRESTTNEALPRFYRVIIFVFKDEYLRALTKANLTHIFEQKEAKGFLCMLRSVDSVHWM